ncbi:hypothetical protein K7432_008407 [Basidiobolus ranarum]|uniref:Serine aminopeptidase S33 domain-containing protein n=1 Tax=Basidiobolus ranarum TaxID=34480 RepID=A0ABR2VYN6_9FUNG
MVNTSQEPSQRQMLRLPTVKEHFLSYIKYIGNPNAVTSTRDTLQRVPSLFFINGLMSDMTSRKSKFLYEYCKENNISFLTYDHFAHGASSGNFSEATISRWYEDLCTIFFKETKGPQILVGSSMGFWLALLLLLKSPAEVKNKVAGIIGIGSSVNTTQKFLNEIGGENFLVPGNIYHRPSKYSQSGYYDIPHDLLQDGIEFTIEPPFKVNCPVSIIHGGKDEDVPLKEAQSLKSNLQATNISFWLIEDGDHRLSRNEDLEVLRTVIENMI